MKTNSRIPTYSVKKYPLKKKNRLKQLGAALLSACLLVLAVSCSAQPKAASTSGTQHTSQRTILRITYDSSLYGTNWMEHLAEAYRKAEPDVDLRITADSAFSLHYAAALNAGTDTPDVVFFSRTDWQSDASAGRLASLASVYTALGTGKTDILRSGVAAYCTQNGVPYVLPWGVRVGGLLYNAALFEQYGWTLPKTTQDLAALCQQITASGIAPFSWNAGHADDWTDILDSWWTQVEGKAGMQTFFAMRSPDVYTAAGRKTALDAFVSLVPANSYGTPLTMNEGSAVKAFTEGRAALLPAGYLRALSQTSLPDSFELRLMALPAPAQAKDTNLLAAQVAGYAAVPAQAANRQAGLSFLSYFAADASQQLFVKDTGFPTAFVLTNSTQDKWPSWLGSAVEGWQKQNWQFFLSGSSVYYTRLFDWPARGSPVLALFSGGLTAGRAFADDAAAAKSKWNAGS